MRTIALAAAVMMLAAACALGGDPLADVVIEEAPPRYDVVSGPPTGPLDLEEASAATTTAPETMRGFLEEHGFKRGYQRTWQRADHDFAAVVVFEMDDDDSATDLVTSLAGEMLGKETVIPIETPGIRGGRGFTLAATQREGEERVMCHVILFPVRQRAFEVRGCAPRATPSEPFRLMAVRQYRAAAGRS